MTKTVKRNLTDLDTIQRSFGSTSMAKMLEQQDRIFRSAGLIADSFSSKNLEEALKIFELEQQGIARRVKEFSKWHENITATSCVLADSVRAFESSELYTTAKSIERATDSLKQRFAINDLFSEHMRATDRVLEEAARIAGSALYTQLATDRILNIANGKQWSNLRWLSDFISEIDFEKYAQDLDEPDLVSEGTINEFSDALNQEDEADRYERIEEVWNRLPAIVKFIISTIIQTVISYWVIALIEGHQIPIIQASAQPIVNNPTETTRSKISSIRNIPYEMCIDVDNGVRFISGHAVRLRESGSIKSDVIATLEFGTVVYIQEKYRSWSKVTVYLEGGETLEGWVFTEYTERFR